MSGNLEIWNNLIQIRLFRIDIVLFNHKFNLTLLCSKYKDKWAFQ